MRRLNPLVRRLARSRIVDSDLIHPGTICGHCGRQQRGHASLNGTPLCHVDDGVYPDCYRLVTVYGELLGSRRDEGVE